MRNRQTIRLKKYDYSLPGAYFVTICAYNKEYLFGEITNEQMQLTNGGKIAIKYWQEIPKHYPNFILDEFIIMPNHVHGILIINNNVGANNYSPVKKTAYNYKKINNNLPAEKMNSNYKKEHDYSRANDYSPLQVHGTSKTIGSAIRGYKIGVTNWFRRNTDIYSVWQRNYYEHIIRNESELNRIREYIRYNPMKWRDDDYCIEIY